MRWIGILVANCAYGSHGMYARTANHCDGVHVSQLLHACRRVSKLVSCGVCHMSQG